MQNEEMLPKKTTRDEVIAYISPKLSLIDQVARRCNKQEQEAIELVVAFFLTLLDDHLGTLDV